MSPTSRSRPKINTALHRCKGAARASARRVVYDHVLQPDVKLPELSDLLLEVRVVLLHAALAGEQCGDRWPAAHVRSARHSNTLRVRLRCVQAVRCARARGDARRANQP
eukprot:7376386-Prymnesium_polylepis.2